MNNNKPNFNDFAAQARALLKTHTKWSYSNGKRGSSDEIDFYTIKEIDALIAALLALHQAVLRQAAAAARISEVGNLHVTLQQHPDIPIEDLMEMAIQRIKQLQQNLERQAGTGEE